MGEERTLNPNANEFRSKIRNIPKGWLSAPYGVPPIWDHITTAYHGKVANFYPVIKLLHVIRLGT